MQPICGSAGKNVFCVINPENPGGLAGMLQRWYIRVEDVHEGSARERLYEKDAHAVVACAYAREITMRAVAGIREKVLECNLRPQCGLGRGRSSVGVCSSSPAETVEAAIDYAACLVRCKGPKGPKALAARAFVRGSDVLCCFVSLPTGFGIYLLRSTAAFI